MIPITKAQYAAAIILKKRVKRYQRVQWADIKGKDEGYTALYRLKDRGICRLKLNIYDSEESNSFTDEMHAEVVDGEIIDDLCSKLTHDRIWDLTKSNSPSKRKFQVISEFKQDDNRGVFLCELSIIRLYAYEVKEATKEIKAQENELIQWYIHSPPTSWELQQYGISDDAMPVHPNKSKS